MLSLFTGNSSCVTQHRIGRNFSWYTLFLADTLLMAEDFRQSGQQEQSVLSVRGELGSWALSLLLPWRLQSPESLLGAPQRGFKGV